MITAQDCQVAALRSTGETLRNIEAQTGMDHVTVSRHLNREEVKNLIDRLHTELIDKSLATAAGNIGYAIDNYKPQAALPTLQRDAQLRDHGFKASQRILEAVGILPSHAPSIQIQQIFNGNTIVAPDVGKLLDTMYGAAPEAAIDVTYTDSIAK